MGNDNMLMLLFSGIWCLVGAVLLAIGLLTRRAWMRREARLSGQTVGQVVNVSMHHSRGSSGTNWHPIVVFRAGNRRVVQESEQGHVKRAFYKGQRVEIYYDPEDPTVFRLEGEQAALAQGTVLAIAGGAALLLGLIIVIISWPF